MLGYMTANLLGILEAIWQLQYQRIIGLQLVSWLGVVLEAISHSSIHEVG